MVWSSKVEQVFQPRPSGTRAGGETATPGNCWRRDQCPRECQIFGKRDKMEGTFWAEDRWNFLVMYNELKGNSERFSELGRDRRWGMDLVRFHEVWLQGSSWWCWEAESSMYAYIHIDTWLPKGGKIKKILYMSLFLSMQKTWK